MVPKFRQETRRFPQRSLLRLGWPTSAHLGAIRATRDAGAQPVRTRSSSSVPTLKHETSTVYKAPYVRGHWVKLVFRLRFERGTEGHMQMWRDGVEVFNDKVMMGYNDKAGPYWKYGIYCQEGQQTTAAR